MTLRKGYCYINDDLLEGAVLSSLYFCSVHQEKENEEHHKKEKVLVVASCSEDAAKTFRYARYRDHSQFVKINVEAVSTGETKVHTICRVMTPKYAVVNRFGEGWNPELEQEGDERCDTCGGEVVMLSQTEEFYCAGCHRFD